jgi:hypothetical protein
MPDWSACDDTTAEAKAAKDLFIQSVNFHAVKAAHVEAERQGLLY